MWITLFPGVILAVHLLTLSRSWRSWQFGFHFHHSASTDGESCSAEVGRHFWTVVRSNSWLVGQFKVAEMPGEASNDFMVPLLLVEADLAASSGIACMTDSEQWAQAMDLCWHEIP